MSLNPESLRYILGLKLRKYRLEKGFGLKEMARRTGLSISYLSEIEKGKKYPKPDKLLELARALEVGFDELVSSEVEDELAPVRELFDSPFIQEFPFDLYGIEPEAIVGLFTEQPTKAGALVRTALEIGRLYDVQVEHFLFAALRSYQYLHHNYFEEIEKTADAFVAEHGWQERTTLEPEELQRVLEEEHGYRVEAETLDRYPALAGLRSVWLEGERPRLLVNPKLLPSQKAFALARELGYLRLGLDERSATSTYLRVDSFDQVINDFKAAYFSGAVLIRRQLLRRDVEAFFRRERWSGEAFLALLHEYRTTPETFFYRLSQLLPELFGLREIFFARFNNRAGSSQFRLTKVLNMSNLELPHGLEPEEHYCRRWPGLALLRQLAERQLRGGSGESRRGTAVDGEVMVSAQRSHFLDPETDFFVVALTRPLALTEDTNSSVTLGFRIDDRLKRRVRFWSDPDVPRLDVNLTCERCPLAPSACRDRAAPAVHVEAEERRRHREEELERLRREVG